MRVTNTDIQGWLKASPEYPFINEIPGVGYQVIYKFQDIVFISGLLNSYEALFCFMTDLANKQYITK